MDKIFILLFAVVIYNGVAYSSPVDGQQIIDAKPSEEKQQPPADHISKKIEPTATPSVQPPPVTQNSSTPAPNQVPTVKNEVVHPAAISTTTSAPQSVSLKTVTQDKSKDTTQVVVDNKNLNQTTGVKDFSIPNKENSSQPATHVPVSTDSSPVPTGKAITDMPRPTTPGQTTTVPPTTAAPVNKTQTTSKPSTTTKPTVITHSSTPKESLVIENNVPAPAEEKHFDGPSFIGGIVLTIGLTAIGFIAFKYYKSGKIDMNYRTL